MSSADFLGSLGTLVVAVVRFYLHRAFFFLFLQGNEWQWLCIRRSAVLCYFLHPSNFLFQLTVVEPNQASTSGVTADDMWSLTNLVGVVMFYLTNGIFYCKFSDGREKQSLSIAVMFSIRIRRL